jgi:hypothetical protein
MPSMLEYKSPTFPDMPPVTTYLIEEPDPEGPFGAKEVGQGPLLPVIPAVVTAVYDALGIHIDEIPLRPDKVVLALQDLERKGITRFGPTDLPPYEFRPPLRVDPPPERVQV